MSGRHAAIPLIISLLTGVIAGLTITLIEHSEEPFKHSLFSLITAFSCYIVAWLIVPVAISLIARRYYFTWSAISGLIMLVMILADRLYRDRANLGSGDVTLILSDLLWFAAVLLVTSGSVSLIRYRRQNVRGNIGTQVHSEHAAKAGKDGAWPPAPRKRT